MKKVLIRDGVNVADVIKDYHTCHKFVTNPNFIDHINQVFHIDEKGRMRSVNLEESMSSVERYLEKMDNWFVNLLLKFTSDEYIFKKEDKQEYADVKAVLEFVPELGKKHGELSKKLLSRKL